MTGTTATGPDAPGVARRPEYLLAALVALLGAATLWPLFTVPWWESHEVASSVGRAVAYADALGRGDLYPRWAHDFYGGFGSPIFNYYPPAVWAGAAVFLQLGLHVTTALKLVLVIAAAVGAAGAFGLARGETGRTDAALVAAAAFAAAPYFFVNVYIRGDLAEACATSLVPWALWGIRALGRVPAERLPRVASAGALALAAVVFTHTLTGLWLFVLAGLFALAGALRAWRSGDRDRAIAFVACLVGAVAVVGIYLLPAVLERPFVRTDKMTGGYYASATHLVEPWRFVRFNFFESVGDGQLGHPVRMPFTIGEPVALALAIVTFEGIRRRGRAWRAGAWWLAVIGLLVVMMPLAAPLWSLPTLPTFTQFPWRLLGLVRACGAIMVGFAFAACVPDTSRHRLPVAAMLALVLFASTLRFAGTVAKLDIGEAYSTPGVMAKNFVSTTALHEYAPAGSTRPAGPRTSLAEIAGGEATLDRVWQEKNRYHLTVSARTAADVDVQLFWFPGWRAEVISGPKTMTFAASPAGLARVHFNGPGHYEVVVKPGSTPVRTAGGILTLLGIVGVWPTLELLRRRSSLRRSVAGDAPARVQSGP